MYSFDFHSQQWTLNSEKIKLCQSGMMWLSYVTDNPNLCVAILSIRYFSFFHCLSSQLFMCFSFSKTKTIIIFVVFSSMEPYIRGTLWLASPWHPTGQLLKVRDLTKLAINKNPTQFAHSQNWISESYGLDQFAHLQKLDFWKLGTWPNWPFINTGFLKVRDLTK